MKIFLEKNSLQFIIWFLKKNLYNIEICAKHFETFSQLIMIDS